MDLLFRLFFCLILFGFNLDILPSFGQEEDPCKVYEGVNDWTKCRLSETGNAEGCDPKKEDVVKDICCCSPKKEER